jgi:hypothetical protein
VIGKRTSKNHLNKFLKYLNKEDSVKYPYVTYDNSDIPVDFWVHDVLGKFACYLVDIAKINKFNTAVTYCSCLKSILLDDYPTLQSYSGATRDTKWYARMGITLKDRYQKRCVEEGTKLVNNDPEMSKEDLEILCKLLLAKGSRSSCESRGGHSITILLYR